ncbi:hypothetical protein D3C87_1929650 [compost metagenome]
MSVIETLFSPIFHRMNQLWRLDRLWSKNHGGSIIVSEVGGVYRALGTTLVICAVSDR